MANLFPAGYEEVKPTGAQEKTDQPTGYKPGIAFDYNAGDFVRDGKSTVLESTGIESWKSWIMNCLNTERYAHLAYSTDFGIELESVFKANNRAEAESILARQINEALLADPYGRTDYVEIHGISWSIPDAAYVDMTVHGIDDVTIDIQTYITRG